MIIHPSLILLDAIVNHPDVRPTIENGSERIDSSTVLDDPDNVVYANENGAVLFIRERPGVYRGHIGMLANGRGKLALAFGRECLDDLFTRFDASLVVASVPLRLRHARLLCRMLGFRSTGADDMQEFFDYRRK